MKKKNEITDSMDIGSISPLLSTAFALLTINHEANKQVEALRNSKSKMSAFLNILGYLLCSGWISLLLVFICTERSIYLKAFGMVFVLAVLLFFTAAVVPDIIRLFLKTKPNTGQPYITETEESIALNKKHFDDKGLLPFTFIITDNSTSIADKNGEVVEEPELDLYPVYVRHFIKEGKPLVYILRPDQVQAKTQETIKTETDAQVQQ